MLMRPLGPKALFYLAAAVSDFFLPKDRLSEHKIQSSDNNQSVANGVPTSESKSITATGSGKKLMIDLRPRAEISESLVDGWAPEGMIVSFKLETDPSLLVSKAHQALEKYSHHLVIGNLLSTRKFEVVFVAPGREEQWITVPIHRRVKSVTGTRPNLNAKDGHTTEQEWLRGEQELEIESLIVPEVIKMHRDFIEKSQETKAEDDEDLLAKALAWADSGATE